MNVSRPSTSIEDFRCAVMDESIPTKGADLSAPYNYSSLR